MTLYHYCSNEAFLKILESGKIWLSDLSLSNDHQEGRWIKKIALEIADEMKIQEEHKRTVGSRIDSLVSTHKTFGFCMSRHPDVLSQWRGYAHNGSGVAIGIKRDFFEKKRANDSMVGQEVRQHIKQEKNINFTTVVEIQYEKEKQKKVLEGLMGAINLSTRFRTAKWSGPNGPLGIEETQDIAVISGFMQEMVYSELIYQIYGIKNPSFEEEGEVRYIKSVGLANYVQKNTQEIEGTLFRTNGTCIVPYMEIKLDYGSIAEVWLGPRNQTPEGELEIMLKACYPSLLSSDFQVKRSFSSYR